MKLSNLWAGYETPILKGINWVLEPQKIYGLLGENGSGKTTLGKVLQGQLPILGGTIEGLDLNTGWKPNRSVQVIPQHPFAFPTLKVLDFVRLITGGSAKKTQGIIDTYCLFCDPSTRLDELSMSGLALLYGLTAMELKPILTFFDETTASMAHDEVEVFMGFVDSYIQKGGTCILVSHRLEEMSTYCDELIILRDGQLAETHPKGTHPQILAKGIFLHLPDSDIVHDKEVDEVSHTITQEIQSKPVWFAKGLKAPSDQAHHWGIDNFEAQLFPNEVLTILGLKEQGIEVLEDILVGLKSPESGTFFPKAQLGSQQFGYIPRNRLTRGLFPNLTIGENLYVHSEQEKKINRIFSGDLPNYNLPVSTLSGGMAQRLLIERELNTDSKAYLVCEPGLGLDPGKKQELYSTLKQARNQGVSFLHLTSDVDEALLLADRIFVLYQGRLLQPDTLESIVSGVKLRELLSDMMVGVLIHE